MKRRPWILILSVFLLAFAFTGLVTIRYVNRSQILREIILEKTAKLPGHLILGRIMIRPASILITDFSFETADTGIAVQIDELKIKYLLTKLLRKEVNPLSLISDILVTHPVILIRKNEGAGVNDRQDVHFESTLKNTFASWTIDKIVVKEGAVRWIDQDGNNWLTLENLEGWSFFDRNKAKYTVTANLFEDRSSEIILSGESNLRTLETNAFVKVEDYALNQVVLPPSVPLEVDSGLFSLNCKYQRIGDSNLLNGEWSLQNGKAAIRHGPSLENIELSGSIVKDSISADGGLLFEGDAASLHLAFALSRKMSLRVGANIPKGRLGEHLVKFAHLRREDSPRGLISAKVFFNWEMGDRNWRAQATATAETLGTLTGQFRDVDVTMRWTKEHPFLEFTSINGDWRGLDVKGAGYWNWRKKKRWDIRAKVIGSPDSTEIPSWAAPLTAKIGEFDLSITNHKRSGWLIRGTGLVRTPGDSVSADFLGEYTLNRYSMELEFPPYHGNPVRLQLSRIGKGAPHLQLDTPQLLAGWWRSDWKSYAKYRELAASVTADISRNAYTGSIQMEEPKSGLGIKLFGSMVSGDDSGLTLVSSYSILKEGELIGNGTCDLLLDSTRLQLKKLTFDDYLVASGEYDLSDRKILTTEILVDECQVGHVVNKLTKKVVPDIEGIINGKMNLTGPFDQPEIEANLELFDGKIGSLKDYWGNIVIHTDNSGSIHLAHAGFGQSGSSLLSGTGLYDVSDDSLDVSFRSEGADASVYMQALTGNSSLVRGNIGFNASFSGSLLSPKWKLELSGTDNQVAGITFDEMHINCDGNFLDNHNPQINLNHLYLAKEGSYEFRGSGEGTLGNGNGSIRFESFGNLLDLFTQLDPIFIEGKGTGELKGEVRFNGFKPSIQRAELDIRDGSLTMRDVLTGIDNMRIKIAIDSTGKAKIERMNAIIGEDAIVEVTNSYNLASQPLDSSFIPLKIEPLGIDFGVILLNTLTDKGVSFRIPGVMPSGVYGRMRLTGKEENEWFSVSGPADSILIRGKAEFSSARITYPPLTSGQSSTVSPFVQILNHARWDADAIVAQDVWYYREIIGLENAGFLDAFSGFFDRISLELKVEPQDPIHPLQIMGRIADDSFRMIGEIRSESGTIEFLDLLFQMESGVLVFDASNPLPIASARAVTDITSEETGLNEQIFLTLYVLDDETGQKKREGRWGEFTLDLENERGDSQEQILASLGYGIKDFQDKERFREKFTSISGGVVSRAMTRRLLRPIERDVAQLLGLDLVRLNPTLAQNFLREQLLGDTSATANGESFYSKYLQASTLTVGKYITKDLYLSYTGQLGREEIYGTASVQRKLGFLQKWSFEYRVPAFSPYLVLDAEYEYDNLERKSNFAGKLKFSIVF